MPRVSRTRRPRNQWLSEDPMYENRIQSAIDGVSSGKYPNLKAASKAENVAYTTLRDRAQGKHQSSQAYHAASRLLTPGEEDVVINWAKLSGESGEPWGKAELRAAISNIAGKPVGQCYVKRFLKKHRDQLKAARPSKLDPKRAKNFNRSNVIDHLTKWQELNEKYGGIPPQNIFNLDEKGIQMGGGRKNSGRKAVFARADKDCYKASSDNLELVTLLECVSAAGLSVPPLFVLQDGPLPDLRLHDLSDVGGISRSKSGWTDSTIMVRWVEEIFIPFALEHCDLSKPVVLWVDGHETHETSMVRRLLYDANDKHHCLFLLACFPSKCTHKLQPLDVAVFSSIQRAWKEHADLCISKGIKINRYTIIPEYMHVRRQLKPDLIRKAFEKTGLYPVNVNIFTDADFAPSKASSTTLHTPANFPAEVPTSPILAPSDLDETDGSEERCSLNMSRSEEDSSDSDDTDFAPSDKEFNECTDAPETTENSLRITRSGFAAMSTSYKGSVPAASHLPDREKPVDQLVDELQEVRHDNQRLTELYNIRSGELKAMNAHLTIIGRQVEQFRVRLDNIMKQKERGSTKVKARFLTLPEHRAVFEAEEAERQQQERVAAEKEAQKVAEEASRQRRINEAAFTRVFEHPLSSYKKKDDLLVIAIALNLPTDGTIPALNTRIKEHLESHPNLANDPRFSGLFLSRARQPRPRYPNFPPNTDLAPLATIASSTLPPL